MFKKIKKNEFDELKLRVSDLEAQLLAAESENEYLRNINNYSEIEKLRAMYHANLTEMKEKKSELDEEIFAIKKMRAEYQADVDALLKRIVHENKFEE